MKAAETKLANVEAQDEFSSSLKDSPQRWWLAVLLVIAMIFCYGQRGALSVAAPFMIEELGLSRAVMGILLSAFFWSYSFMQMPAGWLVDRFGVRIAYGFGYAFWSIFSAITGFARNLGMLIIIRMFLGIGQSVAFPASSRAVANWFQDKERGTVTAAYLAGVRLGHTIVVALGAIFIAAYGWRLFFFLTGTFPMLWLLPWFWFLGRWEKKSESPTATSSKIASGKNPSFIKSLALLKNRTVLGIFLGFFAYDYAWFVYFNWLPGYLRIERGFTPAEMGLYSSIPYIAMSITSLASGILSDWLIRRGFAEIPVRKIFIAIGFVIGCLIVPAGLVEDRVMAVWLLTISLCGLGIASPNCWTLTQAACSKNIVGTVAGIQNFGGNVGGIIAPALTGYIAHATESFALALGITGAVLILGILPYFFLISQKVESEE